jgi:OPA family glycerol-3-phosphate transporter-like MFS transporter
MEAALRPDALATARRRTLFVLWTTYGSFYFCRVNIGPAVTSIRHDVGLTALEIGLVLGAIKLGYATGQLVNGQLTERFGSRRILGIGMIGSAVATLLFAAAPWLSGVPVVGDLAAGLASLLAALGRSAGVDATAGGVLGLMVALAFLNGWFQSGGWPPCVKVAGLWFPVEHRGRTMGILGTSYTVGSAFAIFAVGWMLTAAHGAWRVAFLLPPVVLLVSFGHTMTRLRERPPADGEAGTRDPPAPSSRDDAAPLAPAGRLPLRTALYVTLGNRYIWILALGLFGVDAVRYGFVDWAPGHLAEVQGTGPMLSALKTAVFPLAGAAGTLSSGWLTDRFFQSRRAPVCAILLAAVGVLTIAYPGLVQMGAAPTVVCLALVGFCLFGAQVLLVGTAAQDFARRGATAAAAGFVDFMGHVGAFSGDVVTGLMRQRYGWAGAVSWWCFAAFVAAGLVATLWRVRPAQPAG